MNKGLKALKEIKYTSQEVFDYSPTKQWDAIERELKAFDIIKPYLEKIVGMNVYDKDFYECFLQIGNERVFITKEKYDLLIDTLKEN